jgi:hypothetical protein
LAAAPDFKEDSVGYADFFEYQIPQKILQKKVRRQVVWYLVNGSTLPITTVPGRRELK